MKRLSGRVLCFLELHRWKLVKRAITYAGPPYYADVCQRPSCRAVRL